MDVDKETDDHDQSRLLGRCGIPVETGKGLLPDEQQLQQQQSHNQKKQVRRRLHTSRPYQERLLNMAEARREIVAALKFHRAAMKQSSNRRRQQQQQQETDVSTANLQIPNKYNPPPPQQQQQQQTTSEEENQALYYSHHTQTNGGSSSINSCCSYFLQHQQQHNSGNCNYLWPSSSSSSSSSPFPFSTITDDVDNILDFPLPNQTLGLNLNFHQFANLETSVCRKFVVEESNSSPAVQDHGVKSNTVVGDHVKMTNAITTTTTTTSTANTVEESESAIGSDEQNLVTSAWWYKLFKSTSSTIEEHEPKQEPDCNYNLFDETVNNGPSGVDDVPYWLSMSKEESCFQEIDHTTSQDHNLLPRMDIGEIETIDGDWLS